MHAIRAGTNFVRQRRTKDVRLTQRQEIALRRPVITKTREIIQPERWLRSAVAIRYETAKDDIARRKIVIDTASELVQPALPWH